MSGNEVKRSGLTRRGFLKATGAAAGAAALSGLTACTSQGARELAFTGEEERHYARCMWSGCMHCGSWVTVRDGVVVKREPDPDEPYHNRPCLRGYSQIQRLYHPNRIKYPMKRVGERGSGEWERISWEQAIQEITDKWKGYMEEFGPQSITLYPGTSNGGVVNGSAIGLIKRLWNTAGFSVYDLCIDVGALTGVDRVCGGTGFDQPGNHYASDIMNAKNIVNFSANETESGLFNWRNVMSARENGTRYIVVDPNQSTAAAKADKWIRLRPASDGALIMGIMNVILSEGWEDEDFIRNYTVAPYLVKEDGKFLRASEFGVEPLNLGMNPMTGMPILYDAPIIMGEDGKHGTADVVTSPVIHGSFDIDGHKVTCAYDLFCDRVAEYDPQTVSELTEVSPEDIRYLAEAYANGPTRTHLGMGGQAYNNGHSIGTAIGCLISITGNLSKSGAGFMGGYFGLPWNYLYMMPTMSMGATLPWLEVPTMLETGIEPVSGQPFPIKCIYSMGAMYGGGIDANWVKDNIIDKIDLLVVADTSMTDTARHADYVLPAAHYFEFEDVISNPTNEGAFKWHDKCVDPSFECKPDGQIVRLLAEGLGLGDYFTSTDEEFWAEVMSSPECQAAGITMDRLREEHTIPYELYNIYHENHIYDTPTGKLELYCENPAPRMANVHEWDYEQEHLPYWFEPNEAWPTKDIMKKYPLILTSERSRDRHHTNGFELTWLLEALPEPTLKMNPIDAEARGIKDSDYVEVYNDRGNAVAKAVINPGIRPGMLLYPKGWQKHQFKDGSFSDLSNHEYCPVTVNSSFMDAAVEMRLWKGEE